MRRTITIALGVALAGGLAAATLLAAGAFASPSQPVAEAPTGSTPDVEFPDREPIQAETAVALKGGTFIDSKTLLEVPAGKRLVIEELSIYARVSSAQSPQVSLEPIPVDVAPSRRGRSPSR